MNNNKLNNEKTIINRMGTLKNIVKKYFYALNQKLIKKFGFFNSVTAANLAIGTL